MLPMIQNTSHTEERHGSLLVLALLALIVGAAAGLVGAIFRLTLEQADRLRDVLIAWAQGEKLAGFLIVVVTCAAAALIAAWLVRRFSPHASGSGIPHVEAVLNEQIPQAPFHLIWVKFCGEWLDCRVLLAAGAGAGLATAFNAPMAGAVFVLEELVRRFELRIAVAALGASATAIAVARVFLGDAPDFHVDALAYASAEATPLFFVLGAVAGLAAIAYNRALLETITAAERLGRLSVELRAGLIGAAIGTLAWFAPSVVGGGDPITQRALVGAETLSVLPLLFLLRFGLGTVSYAAGTPGGLFAPMLALGAQLGLLFGLLCRLAFPGLDIQAEGFAVVGMAAFFTGVVRAPLTGIVLVTEMTANVTMLLPMLVACFAAMLVPTLLRDAPIYDSLREHTLRRERVLRQKTQKK